jgi:hypothetical protein
MAAATGSKATSQFTWHSGAPLRSTATWSTIAYGGGRWVAVSQSGTAAVSTNGVSWTAFPTPAGTWQSLAYGNGEFVALASTSGSTEEMLSTSGTQWIALPGPDGPWSAISYGDGLFVAVSAQGQIVTSPNARVWTTRWSHENYQLTAITFGGSHFVAVDAALGATIFSANGEFWSRILSSRPETRWSAVAYGNSNFVALSGSGGGVTETSVYGRLWTLHSTSILQMVPAAAFGCGSFVAVGQVAGGSSGIESSWSGTTWTTSQVPSTSSGKWLSVAYGSHTFVALSSDGETVWTRPTSDCAATLPSTPRQVSGNVHGGEVWTYMHPARDPGGSPVVSYEVTLTYKGTTRKCVAPVSFQPNCIIRGLVNGTVYAVTTQARNRFGYSVTTDPELVIPVASSHFDAIATTRSVSQSTPVVLEVTGITANSEGIYPNTVVTVHVGPQVVTCRPNPFGECLLTVANLPAGSQDIFATYVGYGVSYRSPLTSVVVTP